jgi:ABC-type nickel/cobalt efflux system permease component RcnA
MRLTLALVAAAASLGSIHSLAPDHWVPFAALARAERWSAARTAFVTALCGMGHVTVSVALGLVSAFFGLELLEAFGKRLENLAGILLIGFGVVYGAWGLHRSLRSRWHDHGQAHSHSHWHAHHHGHPHEHRGPDEGRITAWTLFLLFSADPCVAVIPLMFAAAPLGWISTLVVVGAYEAATIGTMIALVLPARAATAAVRGAWVDRYGVALAGAVIAAIGLIVIGLGL